MSCDCYCLVAFPHGAVGWYIYAVCDVVFHGHTHLLFLLVWERADLLALVCGVCCEFVTFPLVSWVRCGT